MRSVVRRATLAQVRQVVPVHPSLARGLVARVYAQVERDFGMLAPPVSLHSPAPASLAACWLMLRETMHVRGLVSRAAREAVAVEVSRGNVCPYCVDVHSTMLHGLVSVPDASAIGPRPSGDAAPPVADPALEEIVGWARAGRTQDAAADRRPLFSAAQSGGLDGEAARDAGVDPVAARTAELAGVAVTFHYLNRMVNVFLPESPFPKRVTGSARARLTRLIGRVMRGRARRLGTPGESLGLLPAAPLPDDLAWATPAPAVADAFARAAAAIDASGRRSAPESVRDLVAAVLAGWTGEPTGLSRAWAHDAVAPLPAADRAAGRLALLTAMASYQVDQTVIADFRRTQPADAALIELTSWASLSAARRVASWQWTRGAP